MSAKKKASRVPQAQDRPPEFKAQTEAALAFIRCLPVRPPDGPLEFHKAEPLPLPVHSFERLEAKPVKSASCASDGAHRTAQVLISNIVEEAKWQAENGYLPGSDGEQSGMWGDFKLLGTESDVAFLCEQWLAKREIFGRVCGAALGCSDAAFFRHVAKAIEKKSRESDLKAAVGFAWERLTTPKNPKLETLLARVERLGGLPHNRLPTLKAPPHWTHIFDVMRESFRHLLPLGWIKKEPSDDTLRRQIERALTELNRPFTKARQIPYEKAKTE
ncbi:MAG: hypothetical protein ACOYOF_11405 [Verrucomicrobiaceae bacterium]